MLRQLYVCTWGLSLWVVALAFLPARLLCQRVDRVALAAAGGFGVSTGNSAFVGSLNYSLRLAAALRMGTRLSIEGSAQLVRGIGQSPYQDLGGSSEHYRFDGASGGLLMDVGRGVGRSLTRLATGFGAYRLRGTEQTDEGFSTTTALGVHMGITKVLSRGTRKEISLGVRAIIMPSVDGGPLFFIPIELGIRFW